MTVGDIMVSRASHGVLVCRELLRVVNTESVVSFNEHDLEASAQIGVDAKELKMSSDSRGWKSKNVSRSLRMGEYLESR